MTPNGIYLLAGGSGTATLQAAFLGPLISRTGDGRVVFLLADSRREDLTHMTELFEAGKIVPVIDGCYLYVVKPVRTTAAASQERLPAVVPRGAASSDSLSVVLVTFAA